MVHEREFLTLSSLFFLSHVGDISSFKHCEHELADMTRQVGFVSYDFECDTESL